MMCTTCVLDCSDKDCPILTETDVAGLFTLSPVILAGLRFPSITQRVKKLKVPTKTVRSDMGGFAFGFVP